MITLIKHLNNVLKGSTLILHIEPSVTAIKSIQRIDYTLYKYKSIDDTPYKIWSLSRTLNSGESIESLDGEVEEELLKFILEGGLNE